MLFITIVLKARTSTITMLVAAENPPINANRESAFSPWFRGMVRTK